MSQVGEFKIPFSIWLRCCNSGTPTHLICFYTWSFPLKLTLHKGWKNTYRWHGQTSWQIFNFCLNCKPDVNVWRRLVSFLWYLTFKNCFSIRNTSSYFYFAGKCFDLCTNITLQKFWKIVLYSKFYPFFAYWSNMNVYTHSF